MEVFWANDTPTMTAKEVIRKMQGKSEMSPGMVRVAFIYSVCFRFHSAKNGTEKQGIPKGRILELVYSCIVCWQDEVFL